MSHTFPALPYAYDALEPYIDAKTMEVHYSKHHRTYYDKFVAAVSGTDLEQQSLTEIFANISQHSPAVRNNGGGYYNHILYWNCMSQNGGGEPTGELGDAIKSTFGDFETFQDQFAQAAINTFGSGFTWLVVEEGQLKIISTSNQDNPRMDTIASNGEPILALDVWEHAYYISYQNRRPDYINAWWNVVNWDTVSENYTQALANKA
ncbi:superoxide dismutase [Vibrio sp. 10N.261.46.E12]|uniref:superoxide dismutase n=1 Tax=unclassified Vibrio TaxID=2614977 RepID=UPI00097716A9|nr:MULTISPECIES: superoxide dismutase [unclassified Vibrio]OMO33494.1 superoxide dismutase [Vibrio sp. 10N.261.45.E1]PMJ36906.1 superoxide dismutase [Vibrio sp. 10N.286.45.B6]PML91737.1 superoxide dismutase [Vibrio sp. 10N.261.49.E11]PMM66533.1 superoxide dismutase [Vibrio sp. 10N.261.46.F12]PMM85580.1 superoxide dismutase [Vibrio sp. 10N.261.46.E8]